MVDVVEQAYQTPRNNPPTGWDATTVRFPAVNTCLCICAVPTQPWAKLVGLHIGMWQSSGESAADSANDGPISAGDLRRYIAALRTLAGRESGKIARIHVVGAIPVWQGSHMTGYQFVRDEVTAWALTAGSPPIEYRSFDDGVAETVNITVTRAGVTAAATAGLAPVPLLVEP